MRAPCASSRGDRPRLIGGVIRPPLSLKSHFHHATTDNGGQSKPSAPEREVKHGEWLLEPPMDAIGRSKVCRFSNGGVAQEAAEV